MSMQGVENMKDALISIIKSIRHEMKDGIMKMQVETSTTSDEVSSIASNEVERAYDNTPPCRLPKELSPGSFLLTFNINNHNLYATATLDAKDNSMPQRVYEYLDVTILGRLFLKSTCAQIDVFNEEISFEIGSKKFKFNIDSYQSMEKIYMVDIAQEEEPFNPFEIGIDLFSYESLACLEFEQRTWSYGTPNPQDKIAKPLVFHQIEEDYIRDGMVNEQGSLRMWICFRDHERQTMKGSYMGFADFLQEQGDDEPRPIRPRPCNYSFEEWMKIRIGHNNLHESDREFIFNKWILDSYDVEEEYAREIGKKGYVLDNVWEKCQQNYKKTNEAWNDEAYEEDEMWRIRDENTDYDPPYDEALPLRRMNGARFKAMIRKELEGSKYVHELLRRNNFSLHRNHCSYEGIKSLREDGNDLKISLKFQISKQSLGSFLS
ncbi:hypothetical protein Tco_0054010 [Tanacetum coccineum]